SYTSTPRPEISTLSLHDALPIYELTIYSGQHEQTMNLLTADFTKRTQIKVKVRRNSESALANQILREGSASPADVFVTENAPALDRKSTRLNSSHLGISYAVFCL